MIDEALKQVRLKRTLDRRLTRGHLWVFSNEVEAVEGNPEPGEEVAVLDGRGRFVGMGLYSSSSLIRARIYTRRRGQGCDRGLIEARVGQALAYRESRLGRRQAFRLIHGEADGLPGLVADVFGDRVVIQIGTAGMERRRSLILDALVERLRPRAVFERSDVPARALEGLPPRKALLWGDAEAVAPIEENGFQLLADLMEGQKTGYFLDQVENRAWAAPHFRDRTVLDLFCYVGAWALLAAVNGARRVVGVDSSEAALELARRAIPLNPIPPSVCSFVRADVFGFIRALAARRERFGVVVLDPPPLARSRKDALAALKAYRELNHRAMRALENDGLLITCSCSHAVAREDFLKALTLASRDARRDFTILREATQAPDHPIHLATPETQYLKVFFLSARAW